MERINSNDLEKRELDHNLRWIPDPPPAYSLHARSKLQRPIAIPRMDVAGKLAVKLPFLRSYSPALRVHDIYAPDFLAFIDNLTIAQAPSPPFQVLQIAGSGIGMIPHHWAMAASAGIGVAAGVGTAAVSATRLKRFLQRVNEEYFGPRGLRVSIVTDSQLNTILGIPVHTAPLALVEDDCYSLRDRRMRILSPHLSLLTIDVPPPSEEVRNVLDKISARQTQSQVEKNERKQHEDYQKSLRKAQKREEKDNEKYAKQARKESRHKKSNNYKTQDSEPEEVEENGHLEIDQKSRSHERESFKHRQVADKFRDRKVMEKEVEKIARMEYLYIDNL